MTTGLADAPARSTTLPAWPSALAVVAHPDDESFGLGAVLDAFARTGTEVSVLCLTHGEASTLHGVPGDLHALRAVELNSAAETLGLRRASLAAFPDGGLDTVDPARLAAEVAAAVHSSDARGLVVFDSSGVTGHRDHAAATAAALTVAESMDLPVLGWTLPVAVAERLNEEFEAGFVGHEAADIDVELGVDRERQRMAALAHASQAVPTSVLWRRLELLGDVEHLRWLRRPAPAAMTSAEPAASDAEAFVMRVDHRGEDRFDIRIRDHVVTIDQPADMGGEDTGPTPTELFVAGLASCVAFYARRYLRRHKLDTTGLVVETSYRLGTKPARVSEVDMRIRLAQDLPDARRDGLLAVARHCTVHNSITTAPAINIDLASADEA